MPNISVSGLSPRTWSQPFPRDYLNHTFASSFTFQRETHTWKAGVLMAVEHSDSNLDPVLTQGGYSFGAGGGFSAFQNFLRGNPLGACGQSCTYQETDVDAVNRFRFGRYEAFVQDSWRVQSTLTLDFGLRYSFYPPLKDANDKLFTFSPDAYDPAKAPAFADDEGVYYVVGSGDPLNGYRIAGQNSPYGRAIYAADTNNLQPRFGAAWSPGGSDRTIMRAGYGMYFDQTQVGMFTQNVQWTFTEVDPFRNDAFVNNVALSNPGRDPIQARYAIITPQPYATSDPFVAPRWQHWNVGVQRRLYSRGMIDVSYVGSRGDHLLRYFDFNQPSAEDQGAALNKVRPFAGLDAIFMRETTAFSRYHGLLSSFRHEAGRAGFLTVNYTFSRNNADASYDNSDRDAPQNVLDKTAEYGSAQTDRSHIFNMSYVYELPFGRGSTGLRKGLMQGWQVAGITRVESGPAARLRAANCNFLEEWCATALRPNQVGDPGAGEQEGLYWFDSSAFVNPPAREYGTAPVSPFRLPGRHQWDITLAKNFDLAGTARLQFRAEMINVFNQTQFLDVSTFCSSAATVCGTSGSGGVGEITSTRPPREIQLGLRLNW